MLTSAFAALGAGQGAGGGRLPPAMGRTGSGGGAVAATGVSRSGARSATGVGTPLAQVRSRRRRCGCPPARWQAKEVGADAKVSSSQIVAISFPLYKLPAKTTPTRASRLVLDAALRVRSSRHVPASRRPDHRTDATRRARAAPHVGRRRVASVVAARLLFRPDVRREHAVEVPVPARAPHSINLRELRLGGVSAWQDRPAAPHAACARSAWHTQGRSEHNPKPQHDPKAKAKPTPTSSPDHARSRSSRPSTAQMPRCESRSAGESG